MCKLYMNTAKNLRLPQNESKGETDMATKEEILAELKEAHKTDASP